MKAFIIGLASRSKKICGYSCLERMGDLIATIGMVVGVWIFCSYTPNISGWKACVIVVAILLTSLGFWENFVSCGASWTTIKYLEGIKRKLTLKRASMYIFISPIKILMFASTVIAFLNVQNQRTPINLFYEFQGTDLIQPAVTNVTWETFHVSPKPEGGENFVLNHIITMFYRMEQLMTIPAIALAVHLGKKIRITAC